MKTGAALPRPPLVPPPSLALQSFRASPDANPRTQSNPSWSQGGLSVDIGAFRTLLEPHRPARSAPRAPVLHGDRPAGAYSLGTLTLRSLVRFSASGFSTLNSTRLFRARPRSVAFDSMGWDSP